MVCHYLVAHVACEMSARINEVLKLVLVRSSICQLSHSAALSCASFQDTLLPLQSLLAPVCGSARFGSHRGIFSKTFYLIQMKSNWSVINKVTSL